MRCARTKYVGEIEQTNLLSSGWKSEIGPRDNPPAVAIGNFKAQRASMFMLPLADCDVDGRIRWVHPAFGYEIQRAVGRNVIAQIYFDVMIARDALILAASEGVEISIVEIAHNFRYIMAVVIDCTDDLMRSLNRDDSGLYCRHCESLVSEDLRARRMIHGHESEIVVIVSLP